LEQPIGVLVAGVVLVDWLDDGGSGGGHGCCCLVGPRSCALAFSSIASDEGVGGVDGNGCCWWCKHAPLELEWLQGELVVELEAVQEAGE